MGEAAVQVDFVLNIKLTKYAQDLAIILDRKKFQDKIRNYLEKLDGCDPSEEPGLINDMTASLYDWRQMKLSQYFYLSFEKKIYAILSLQRELNSLNALYPRPPQEVWKYMKAMNFN